MRLFNIHGYDGIESRKIIGGNSTNLMQLNDIKFQWARAIYNQMRENFWIPQKVDLTQDVTDYTNLLDEERKAFEGILAYLTFLDSIQTRNLPYLGTWITAPEVALCFSEQASQEALHNESYQYVIESVIPKERRSEIYELWRQDSILRERCEYIANLYQGFIDNPTNETFLMSVVANYLLEGLYFYNGFIYFYNLSSRNLMPGTADIFRTINRDEATHVWLFQNLLQELLPKIPHDVETIRELFRDAVSQEIVWTNHIIGDSILGITRDSTAEYTKYLANTRLKAIGLSPLYEGVKNPYKHLEQFADTGNAGGVKGNFFEATVTAYNQSSSVKGWDF